MIAYDNSILQKYAQRLYSRANTAIFVCTCIGLIAGAVAGLLLAESNRASSNDRPMYILISAVACGLIGLLIGIERAFSLKLRAQLVLCQAQIENNTARSSSKGIQSPAMVA
jgi:hypothetical protein